MSDSLFIDFRGEHRPSAVLVLGHPDYTAWQVIRRVVIQATHQGDRWKFFCFWDGYFFINWRSLFRRARLSLSQSLLLKHQINSSKLFGAVYLIQKLPIYSKVVLCAVKILLEGSNHFSANSEIVLSATRCHSSLLKLEFGSLDLLSMLFLQFFGIHAHLK